MYEFICCDALSVIRIALFSLIATVPLVLQLHTFSWLYTVVGVVILLGIFIYSYHFQFSIHFRDIHQYAHLDEIDHMLGHARELVLTMLLFVGSTSVLHFLYEHPFEYVILTAFFLCTGMYLMSIDHGVKTLFEYEEKHLHLMAIVKIYTVCLLIASIVFCTVYSFIHMGVSLGLISFVFLWFLHHYARQHKHPRVAHEIGVTIAFSIGAAALFQFLFAHIFAVQFMIAVLFVYYYFSWGIFHHYLKKDLTKKVVIEYFLFSILIISILSSTNLFMERVL